jgi:hypothetical protein
MKKWTVDKATVDWICPACQFHYVGKPTPLCYCGKVKVNKEKTKFVFDVCDCV